ncbi:hypothetical protein ACOME3_000975 [Neoechinorhynchus agilis]
MPRSIPKALRECCERFPSLCEEVFGDGRIVEERRKQPKSKERNQTSKKSTKKSPQEKTAPRRRRRIAKKVDAKENVSCSEVKMDKGTNTKRVSKSSREKPSPPIKRISTRKIDKMDSVKKLGCDPNNVPNYKTQRRALGCMVKRAVLGREANGQTAIKESEIIQELLACLKEEGVSKIQLRNRLKFTIDQCVEGKTLLRGDGGTLKIGPKLRNRCAPGIKLQPKGEDKISKMKVREKAKKKEKPEKRIIKKIGSNAVSENADKPKGKRKIAKSKKAPLRKAKKVVRKAAPKSKVKKRASPKTYVRRVKRTVKKSPEKRTRKATSKQKKTKAPVRSIETRKRTKKTLKGTNPKRAKKIEVENKDLNEMNKTETGEGVSNNKKVQKSDQAFSVEIIKATDEPNSANIENSENTTSLGLEASI